VQNGMAPPRGPDEHLARAYGPPRRSGRREPAAGPRRIDCNLRRERPSHEPSLHNRYRTPPGSGGSSRQLSPNSCHR
jgi:hypothetical protein